MANKAILRILLSLCIPLYNLLLQTPHFNLPPSYHRAGRMWYNSNFYQLRRPRTGRNHLRWIRAWVLLSSLLPHPLSFTCCRGLYPWGKDHPHQDPSDVGENHYDILFMKWQLGSEPLSLRFSPSHNHFFDQIKYLDEILSASSPLTRKKLRYRRRINDLLKEK